MGSVIPCMVRLKAVHAGLQVSKDWRWCEIGPWIGLVILWFSRLNAVIHWVAKDLGKMSINAPMTANATSRHPEKPKP